MSTSQKTSNDLATTIRSECNPLSFSLLQHAILTIGNGFVTC